MHKVPFTTQVAALEAAPPDGWPDSPPSHKTRTRVYLRSDDGSQFMAQFRADQAAGLRLGDPVIVTYEFGED